MSDHQAALLHALLCTNSWPNLKGKVAEHPKHLCKKAKGHRGNCKCECKAERRTW